MSFSPTDRPTDQELASLKYNKNGLELELELEWEFLDPLLDLFRFYIAVHHSINLQLTLTW